MTNWVSKASSEAGISTGSIIGTLWPGCKTLARWMHVQERVPDHVAEILRRSGRSCRVPARYPANVETNALAMIDILVRFGVFLVVLTVMLVAMDAMIPTQGPPVSKYSLEYLTRKNDLRPGPNPIQVRAP